jgi:antitoxin component YwqK of YwqJK toxin-antitoxin module
MKRYFLIFTGLLFSLLVLISCEEKLTSVTVNFFDDGTPQQILYYSIKNGDSILMKSIEYHPNHKIFIEGDFKNGKREGTWKSWYENGNLWSISTFREGMQVGETSTYHENGNLRYSGTYNNESKRTGTWKFYDENNNLLQTMEY